MRRNTSRAAFNHVNIKNALSVNINSQNVFVVSFWLFGAR
jgi:hypothetical protein